VWKNRLKINDFYNIINTMKLTFGENFDWIKEEFLKSDVWEPKTTEYIEKHLKTGQTFVDIGANVGYFSILASKLGAKVLAFEPSLNNRTLLEKNIKDNNCDVQVFSQALSNENGSAILYTDTTPGQYSLMGSGKGEAVDVVTYDSLNLPIPDFIKIDTEGNERKVLEGMQSVLTTDKPITIIIEDWKGETTDFLIRTHGFNLVETERMHGNKILTKNQPFEYKPEPFTIHLLSLPHTETTKDYSWCAFTSLVINMATMMTQEGHKVILYAGENNEAECFEHINCSGKPKSSNFFVPPWTYEYFAPMNNKIIEEMKKRIQIGDIILQSTSLQSVVAQAFPRNISMEYAIGYGGCKSACRVFPCEAWRHEIYGRDAAARGEDIHTVMGYSSDAVIPHMFNVDQFPEGKGDGGYLLFVGRLGGMKGEQVAVETSKRTGIPLKLIGPGTPPNYGEYLGVKQPKERAELMGGAIAVIAPSMFPEPFNMVAVEAQMCGTPVVSTDWGGFTETVQNGLSGYRCSTLGEFAQRTLDAKKLDRKKIRERAISTYSFKAIGPMYTKFFHRLEEIIKL
jgi:FkbM family methyltransferase